MKAFRPRRPHLTAALHTVKHTPIADRERKVLAIGRRIITIAAKLKALQTTRAALVAERTAARRELRVLLQSVDTIDTSAAPVDGATTPAIKP